jgi:hypothetical protein
MRKSAWVRQQECLAAALAAATAISTSRGVLRAISAATSPFSGLINGKYSPDSLGTNLPSINCSQRWLLIVILQSIVETGFRERVYTSRRKGISHKKSGQRYTYFETAALGQVEFAR